MNRGYIKLHRQIKDHWLWKEKRKYSKAEAWIDLLFRANFTKGNKCFMNGSLINQTRGDLITSQDQLSKDWDWNPKSVKKFLETLKKDGMITYEATNQYTKIFLVNYEKYNPVSTLYGERDTIPDGGREENEVDSDGMRGETINNYKNGKNDEEGEGKKVVQTQTDYNKDEINEIFNVLEEINPLIERGASHERRAAADLIRRLGFEKAAGAARAAVACHGRPYAPTITSPSILKKKIGELSSYIKRESQSRAVIIN